MLRQLQETKQILSDSPPYRLRLLQNIQRFWRRPQASRKKGFFTPIEYANQTAAWGSPPSLWLALLPRAYQKVLPRMCTFHIPLELLSSSRQIAATHCCRHAPAMLPGGPVTPARSNQAFMPSTARSIYTTWIAILSRW